MSVDPQPSEHQLAWDVLDEHLEEAEFLFEAREAALDSPLYTLAKLATGPERRLLAHVDALVIGGPLVASELLLPTLEDPDADYEKIAAATLAVIEGSPRELDERVWIALEQGEASAQRDGIVRALQLSPRAGLERAVLGRLTTQGAGMDPLVFAAYLDVFAARHVAPTEWLAPLLERPEPAILRAAASLVRFSQDRKLLHPLATLAQSPDEEVRRATLETALITTMPGAWENACYWAFAPGESALHREALVWVASLGDAGAQARVLALVDDPARRADAIWALGFCGRAAAVDRCVALLADEEIGPLAGEVVCAIAGLPRDEDRFWQDAPPDEDESLPSIIEDDLEADLVPPPEASLPIPQPEEIAAWWQSQRGAFNPAYRYIEGRLLDLESLLAALHHGPLRRRGPLAFELAVRSRGVGFVNTRALSVVQVQQLHALTALEGIHCQSGWPAR